MKKRRIAKNGAVAQKSARARFLQPPRPETIPLRGKPQLQSGEYHYRGNGRRREKNRIIRDKLLQGGGHDSEVRTRHAPRVLPHHAPNQDVLAGLSENIGGCFECVQCRLLRNRIELTV